MKGPEMLKPPFYEVSVFTNTARDTLVSLIRYDEGGAPFVVAGTQPAMGPVSSKILPPETTLSELTFAVNQLRATFWTDPDLWPEE
jgi:hypothetical protein